MNKILAKVMKQIDADELDVDSWFELLEEKIEKAFKPGREADAVAEILEAFLLSEDDELRDGFLDIVEELSAPADAIVASALGNPERDRQFQEDFAANVNPESITAPETAELLLRFIEQPNSGDSDWFNSTKSGVATAALCPSTDESTLRKLVASDVATAADPAHLLRVAMNAVAPPSALADIFRWLKSHDEDADRPYAFDDLWGGHTVNALARHAHSPVEFRTFVSSLAEAPQQSLPKWLRRIHFTSEEIDQLRKFLEASDLQDSEATLIQVATDCDRDVAQTIRRNPACTDAVLEALTARSMSSGGLNTVFWN